VSTEVSAAIDRAQAGHVRELARLVTAIENDPAMARTISQELLQYPGAGHLIGITGPPGVGKSTTTSALVSALRAEGHRVAVLAIDPSSPFSGGALLGDRVRMQEHATDADVFIRSMAARGHLGGLAAAAPAVVALLQACGFDWVLIETVGVGQSEIDIASTADTTVVLLAPGMGDGVQAAKAGILEIGDVFAVNKADRDGADTTVRELRSMIALGNWSGWEPTVVSTVASRGEGIPELREAIAAHGAWLMESGEQQERRRHRIAEEVRALVIGQVDGAFLQQNDEFHRLCDQVAAGAIDSYAAADAMSRRILQAQTVVE
jgi:LAO/AO transport system kinase